jgi:hypothetical protein
VIHIAVDSHDDVPPPTDKALKAFHIAGLEIMRTLYPGAWDDRDTVESLIQSDVYEEMKEAFFAGIEYQSTR